MAFIPDTPKTAVESGPTSGFIPDDNTPESQANAAMAHDVSMQSKYGSGAQQGIAALESIGRGATGPIAPYIESKLGISTEAIRGREEANPLISAAGTIGGLLVPGGQGAALEKIGAKVSSGIIEKGILSGAAKGAVKLAAENAVYQAGDETSKMILNDPNQSMQSALSNIGLAAVIGGAAGGALGSVSPLWKATVGNKAEGLVQDFKARMREHMELPSEPTTTMRVEPNSEISPVKIKVSEEPIEPKVKEVYDPFTKTSSKIEVEGTPKTEGPRYDPFTKKYEQPKLETPATKIEAKSAADTLGGKLADMYTKYADQAGGRILGGAAGGTLGKMTHIPYGGTIGAVLGEKYLGPILESILPSIAKPLIEKESTGAGLKAAIDYGMNIVKGQKLVNNAVRSVFKPNIQALPDSKQPTEETRKKLELSLGRIQNNPMSLANSDNAISHYMPQHAVAFGQVTMNAVNFLSSLKPQSAPRMPLDPPKVISPAIQSQYNRVLDIAQQPLIVLSSIKNGTLTSHDVIALHTMYPELYEGMKQKLMSQMVEETSKGGNIPYDTRLSLSLFLQQPLDSTMKPEAIMAAQPTPKPQEPQPSKPQKVSQGASSTLTKGAKSMQTASQASEAMHSTGKA